MDWPHKFLGRCAICLDNAYFDQEPCTPKIGVNGAPQFEDECLIYQARRELERAVAAEIERLQRWRGQRELEAAVAAERERCVQLEKALRMVLENVGGHQHWDSYGTAGAGCPICQRQNEAALQATEILNAATIRKGDR